MYVSKSRKQLGASLIFISIICSIIFISTLAYLERAKEMLTMTHRFFYVEQAFLAADAGLNFCEQELMRRLNISPSIGLSFLSKENIKALPNKTQARFFNNDEMSHFIAFDEGNRAGFAKCNYQPKILNQNAENTFEINSTGYSIFSQATATVRLTIDVIQGQIVKRWQLVNFF